MASEQKETPLEIFPKLREITKQWTQCADCNAANPKWAETSRGILICLQCAGVHRNLGVHISKVRSLTLDNWEQKCVDDMVESNTTFNAIWEYHVDAKYMKPTAKTRMDIRTKYIKAKYVGLEAYDKKTKKCIPAFHKDQFGPQQPVYASNKYDEDESKSSNEMKDKDHVGMVVYTGVITIKVIGAKDLPKADTFSDSDPYVVFENHTGQAAKTKVIDDNNNPTWNETLILSVNESKAVSIRIYDKDKLSDDLLCVGTLDVGKQCTNGQKVEFNMPMTVEKEYQKQKKKSTLKFSVVYDKMDAQ